MHRAFKHIMFLALIMHLYFHNQFPIMLLHTHSYYTRCDQTSCSSRYSHIHTFHYYASMHLSQSFYTFIKHISRMHLSYIYVPLINHIHTYSLTFIHHLQHYMHICLIFSIHISCMFLLSYNNTQHLSFNIRQHTCMYVYSSIYIFSCHNYSFSSCYVYLDIIWLKEEDKSKKWKNALFRQ